MEGTSAPAEQGSGHTLDPHSPERENPVSATGPDVVILLQRGLLAYDPIFGDESGVEEGVASADGAVSIWEASDKPKRVRHDRDVTFPHAEGRLACIQVLINNN